eukprot:366085-Chlamydomonas_euryale.AAC.8
MACGGNRPSTALHAASRGNWAVPVACTRSAACSESTAVACHESTAVACHESTGSGMPSGGSGMPRVGGSGTP